MSPPQIVRTRIHHARTVPVRHAFTYRSYSWLVDLDAVPELPRLLRRLAGFHAADHAGDPRRTLRENVDAYLAALRLSLMQAIKENRISN